MPLSRASIDSTVSPMAILSVDLAYSRWSDLGLVILDRVVNSSVGSKARDGISCEPSPSAAPAPLAVSCEIFSWDGSDLIEEQQNAPIEAEILAGRLNHLCNARGIRILMLDGPQAWKSASNGCLHARASESLLNTAAKTGLPGLVKPATYRTFSEFCVDVYDGLCRRGWRRLATSDQPTTTDRILVESYPHAAWKSLGLKPLKSKRRARVSDIAEAIAALNAVIPLQVDRLPNHDQLQAIVGGLPGLALEARDQFGARIVGMPPHRENGQWREGFIVLPALPQPTAGLRWLD